MALKSVAELVEAFQGNSLLEEAQLQELKTKLGTQFPDAMEASKEMIRRKWLTMYQAKMVLLGKIKNLFLGQYLLLDLLGEGGMGQVYKARHRRLDRVDALKVIRPIHVQSADALRRFLREARAAARLSHPNIVAIHDAGEDSGTHYLAMEFVPGTDLACIIRQSGPLAWASACEYLRQAAIGLQHAQQRGMVHRDIKPANLLLTADKALIKILDMGLARLQEVEDRQQSLSELTQTGVVMGTPDYMAPEQAIDSRHVDTRADIYSLGCTLYYLLSGHPPFPQSSLTQKLIWHQQRIPEPLSKHNIDIPPALSVVLERMMAKKAEDRYQTAGEVAQALSAFAKLPEGVSADAINGSRSDGTLRISKLKSDSNNTPVGHSPKAEQTKQGNVTFPTVGGTESSEFASSSNVNDETVPKTPAVKNRAVKPAIPRKVGPPPLPGPPVVDPTEKVDFPKSSANTTRSAKDDDEDDDDDDDDSPGFWSNTLSTIVTVAIVIGVTSGVGWFMNRQGDSDPGIAPGTGSGNGVVPNIVKEEGEQNRLKALQVYKHHSGKPVNGVAFSQDGLRAVSAGSDNKVIIWDLGTSNVERELENFPDIVTTVDWAPFKDWILTGGKSKTGILNRSVKVYDITEGQNSRQRSLAPIDVAVTSAAFSPDGNLAIVGGGVQNRALTQLWDVKNEKLLFDLQGHRDLVTKVVFSQQGDLVASCSLDKTIRIWNVKDGEEVRAIKNLPSVPRCLVFSQDGKTLFVGREDNVIQLWDLNTGLDDGVLTGHSKAVLALALAPNGRQLVSGSGDKTVRVWDLLKRTELLKLEAHDDIVTGVAIQPSGLKLLSCSQDGTVKLWLMPK